LITNPLLLQPPHPPCLRASVVNLSTVHLACHRNAPNSPRLSVGGATWTGAAAHKLLCSNRRGSVRVRPASPTPIPTNGLAARSRHGNDAPCGIGSSNEVARRDAD